MVLEKYPVHLSAKAISRTILKETGKEVNIRAVVRSLEDIPVHVTQTTRRKYKLHPSSGTNPSEMSQDSRFPGASE